MRFLITALVFLSGVSAMASVNASDYTCSELKGMVKSQGELVISTSLGSYTVYPNQMACYYQGLHTEYVTVRAADQGCVVGLACDYYYGGQ